MGGFEKKVPRRLQQEREGYARATADVTAWLASQGEMALAHSVARGEAMGAAAKICPPELPADAADVLANAGLQAKGG